MEPQVDRIEVDVNKPEPPSQIRPEPLETGEHEGDYAPEPALLEILASVSGAPSWAGASEAQRQRVLAGVSRLRTAGLSTRTIGLVAETRVAELQGITRDAARVARSRAESFPAAAVTVRLWDETDVENYLRWRVASSTYPRRFKNRYAPAPRR